MYLYHLTLQKPTAITAAAEGNFTSAKAKEIVVARGRILELLRLDVDQGRMVSVFSQDVFGVIRSIAAFRLTGATCDYIVVGSDSGRIVILEFDVKRNCFKKVHEETFGRSGCRRIVPGQYLAMDPHGRAVMIGAVEKQKFVYILNRDSAARLTISSPLEAHKSRTLCFSMVGIDVDYENPVFACIEIDYNEVQDINGDNPRQLIFYELDLGSNHVVRKASEKIDPAANMLISVPGGKDGPGGVLVCAENFIYWKNSSVESNVNASIPRREDLDEARGVLLTSHTMIKARGQFFFLAQSEFGDLYKITLSFEDNLVESIQIRYFDTIPCCISMNILRPAYLFAATESGNHFLYQFISTGDDEEQEQEIRSSSSMNDGFESFIPRGLKNLEVVEQQESMSPIIGMQIKDIAREPTPQIYALCGMGISSSLRVLRHGLEISEMATNTLPGVPSAVWTVKKSRKEKFDSYIVISYVDATLTLSVGASIEEASEAETGFVESSPTLYVRQIGEDSLLQILPGCIRHIRADKRIQEWRPPGKKQILHCTANQQQVVVALTGGELCYFHLDPAGQLEEVARTELGHEVSCLDIAPIPSGLITARYLAVGDWDNHIRILSLDPDSCLQLLTINALSNQPVALSLIYMKNDADQSTLFLNIGLQDGVLLRMTLDPNSADLSDLRRKFLGPRAVKLFKLSMNNSPSLLALSSRSWLAYNYQSRFHLTPLSYSTLEYAAGFTAEQCPEGIVAISQNTLRIISVERLGEVFNQKEIQLKYTPRKFIVEPNSNNLIIIESEHNSNPIPDLQHLSTGDEQKWISPPKAGNAKWASCIRLFDTIESRTLEFVELDNNEAALSVCTCVFHDKRGQNFLIVGTAKDFQLQPKKLTCGYIHVYQIIQEEDGAKKFKFIHKTEVEDVPGALCPFQGRVLAGVGNVLRIYDLGKRKLLRKCETKLLPRMIKTIHTQGDRIYVGDLAESFHFLKYKRFENQLFVFADDTSPRWVTASCLLDYDTIAGGDKFGNLFICRLPKEIAEEVEDDPTAAHLQHMTNIKGAPHKLNEIIQFHVGEVITQLTKASLVPGGASILIYGTIHGAIGAFVPFVSREDVDFFSKLEMHMRQSHPPLCGRDHMAYRSYYFPVKNVIDGDLCEQFSLVDRNKQESIADNLSRSVGEILKKLEDMRNRCL